MEQTMENSKRDEDKWVHDSSVDHKGKIFIRASTGVWKASFFIIDKYIFHLYTNNINQKIFS